MIQKIKCFFRGHEWYILDSRFKEVVEFLFKPGTNVRDVKRCDRCGKAGLDY